MHNMCDCSGSKACTDAVEYLFAADAGGSTQAVTCTLCTGKWKMCRVWCRALLVFKRCSRSRRGCSACLVFLISCSFFSPQTILRQQQQQPWAQRGGVLTFQRSCRSWLDSSFLFCTWWRGWREISLIWYWFSLKHLFFIFIALGCGRVNLSCSGGDSGSLCSASGK